MGIIHAGAGKVIQEWQLAPFAWHFPSPFCQDSEAFPRESWHDGEWPLTKGNWPCSRHLSLIPYTENHLQRKIPGHWGPQNKKTAKLNAVHLYAFENCFAQLSERYTKCCSQGKLLRRKIKECLSYCICICSHWPSPGTLLLDVLCVNHKELTLPNQQTPMQSERTTACELHWYGLEYQYLLWWMGPRMGFINLVNRDTFLQ